MVKEHRGVLMYEGCKSFRHRLVLSILSGKPIKIDNIRKLHEDPGLQEFEVNLIRLLDKITNGTTVKLDETGTSLFFAPGLLDGGTFEHECCVQRSIGYYLEVLLLLGSFCKNPLNIRLRGVTSNNVDPSVDHVKNAMLPVMKKFILEDEDLKIDIISRGMPPLGGGEVRFHCPIRRQLRPVQLATTGGKVRRVRGVAYALRVAPAIANRLVEAAKGALLAHLPDVYISTYHGKGGQSGKSAGFGVHLYAETTDGTVYAAEQVSEAGAHCIPEEIGLAAAQRLLQQIYLGGCADPCAQAVAILGAALAPKDASRLRTGPLTDHAIALLQLLRDFFGVTFKLEAAAQAEEEQEAEAGADKVLLTCIGIGYSNLSKRTL